MSIEYSEPLSQHMQPSGDLLGPADGQAVASVIPVPIDVVRLHEPLVASSLYLIEKTASS